MTQQELADTMSVGIASIKRWEGRIIQTAGMDKLLRQAFWPSERKISVTGNRPLSIERVKLVALEFNKYCKGSPFEDGDKFLYSGKLLWYADMVAYRDLGRSITGATYAALPQGPQLNNYNELADIIFQSNENNAEPLTKEEKRVIKRVLNQFPGKTDAYHASHKEVAWQSKNTGELIPYTDAAELIHI